MSKRIRKKVRKPKKHQPRPAKRKPTSFEQLLLDIRRRQIRMNQEAAKDVGARVHQAIQDTLEGGDSEEA